MPPGTSVQLAEFIALTQALELEKGKRIAIYIDSKYAFLVLHAHAAIWKERGHLTTRGSPVKYGDQILRLLEAVHLPVLSWVGPTKLLPSVYQIFSGLVRGSSDNPSQGFVQWSKVSRQE